MDTKGFSFAMGVALGLLVATIVCFNVMQDEAWFRERSRNGLWHEAVARGYAEQLETEDGKPAYRWKEK